MAIKKMTAVARKNFALLIEAMNTLRREKKYEDITVTELCNLSGVPRISFYKRFKDKEDFLSFANGLLAERIVSRSEDFSVKETVKAALELAREDESFFRAAKEDREIFQRVLKEKIFSSAQGKDDKDDLIAGFVAATVIYALNFASATSLKTDEIVEIMGLLTSKS